MAYPSEYETAVSGLKTLRKNVERIFIEGRVKALLNASVETLHQYQSILVEKIPSSNLVGNVNRFNLVFTGLGVPLWHSGIAQVEAKYTGGKATYPIYVPPKVSQRDLPQVDVFVYTPSTDVELLEKGSGEIWSNTFILQTERYKYSTTPDASNIYFNYYKMSPIGRAKVTASLSSPESGFENITALRGEATVLYASVKEPESDVIYDYDLYVFLDADLFTSSGYAETVPLAVIVTGNDYLLPENAFLCAGKRVSTKDKGLYVGWIQDGQLVGFTRTHREAGVTEVVSLYAEPRILTIDYNPSNGGYTNPAKGVYNKKATDVLTVYAYPNSGWSFMGWLLDGFGVSSSANPIQLKMYRDHTLVALFKQVQSAII